MFNVLASEIEDIIALTGNISLPQIVVTIANVILLGVNIILAIIKKVRALKKTKVGTTAQNESVDLVAVFEEDKKKENEDLETTTYTAEITGLGDIQVSAEARDPAIAIHNAIMELPDCPARKPLEVLCPFEYLNAIFGVMKENPSIVSVVKNVFEVIDLHLSLTKNSEVEVIKTENKTEVII